MKAAGETMPHTSGETEPRLGMTKLLKHRHAINKISAGPKQHRHDITEF